jgi:hypothetical protein
VGYGLRSKIDFKYFWSLKPRVSIQVASCTFLVCTSVFVSSYGGASDCPTGYDTLLSGGSILSVRDQFVANYLNARFSSPEQNLKWMSLAKRSGPSDKVLFGDIEFSVLQKINNLTNDKNLATSISNKHKELTFTAIEALRKKYSKDLTVETYSDFKSARFAFVQNRNSKRSHTKLMAMVRKDMGKMFDQVNDEFVAFMKAQGLNVDQAAENWFRGGVGPTADEANFAARVSRDLGGKNILRDIDESGIQANLNAYRLWAESMRTDVLTPDPAMAPLIEGGFVKDEVLDILKKTPAAKEAIERIKAKYNANLSEQQIERLSIYNEIIDKFSPGIHVAERQIASLEAAEFGGLSADFSGLGAKNRGATARAIAEGKTLREAIAISRRNEQEVTAWFKESTAAFSEIINRFVATSTSSGDDFVGIAGSSFSDQTKKDLISEVATLPVPSAQRLSFISAGANPTQRNLMAAHGEAIEKTLRMELEGVVSQDKLRELVFGVDMRAQSAGSGEVSLLIGEGKKSKLSKSDRASIQMAFENAVRIFNRKPDVESSTAKTYVPK